MVYMFVSHSEDCLRSSSGSSPGSLGDVRGLLKWMVHYLTCGLFTMPTNLIHFPPTPLGKGVDLRCLQTMYRAFAVHRLPCRQPQDELAGHARLAAPEALAQPQFRRHRLPGTADPGGKRFDDACSGGRRDIVLGARARVSPGGCRTPWCRCPEPT